MYDSEIGLAEVVRGLTRIENALKEMVTKSVYEIQTIAFNERIRELEESNKWMSRSIVGSFILAFGGVVFGAVK